MIKKNISKKINKIKENIDKKINEIGMFVFISFPMMLALIIPVIKHFFNRQMIKNIDERMLTVLYGVDINLWLVCSFISTLISMSQVLISRAYGEEKYTLTSAIAWQSIFFSFSTGVFFVILTYFFPELFIYKNFINEKNIQYCIYTQIYHGLYLFSVALNSFFVGINKANIVLLASLIDGFFHIIIGYSFIKEINHIPINSILSTSAGIIFYINIFLSSSYMKKFNTNKIPTSLDQVNEYFAIGWPSAFNHLSDMFCIQILVRTLTALGGVYIMNQEFISSINRSTMFFFLAIERAVSTLSSYYIGQKNFKKSLSVLNMGIITVLFSSILGYLICTIYCKEIVNIFWNCSKQEESIMCETIKYIMIINCIDGPTWMIVHFLISCKENKFILLSNIFTSITFLLIPSYVYYNYVENPSVHFYIKVSHLAYSTVYLLIAIYKLKTIKEKFKKLQNKN